MSFGAAKSIEVLDLGVAEYLPALELQKDRVQRLRSGDGAQECLIFVEHPAVYTVGRKGQRMFPMGDASVPTINVERGGETTYHNPGQLVAYPILRLEDNERDVHGYLRKLEEVLIAVLADYGLQGESRKDATGVWLVGEEKKIASIGVALTGWVSYHGIALNVDNDLSGFGQINPCGFSSNVMTSLKERLSQQCPSMAEVKSRFLFHFESVFSRNPIPAH